MHSYWGGRVGICDTLSGGKIPVYRTGYFPGKRGDVTRARLCERAIQVSATPAMIPPSEARQRAQENLEGFPPTLVNTYLAFAETGDLARLDEVMLGVLQFYLAKPPPAPLASLPGSTRLVEDLGCNSLTMADMIFRGEGLLAIKPVD